MFTTFVRALLATPTARLTSLVTLALSLALCAVPLFGVHGVESAFVLGLLLPLLAALHVERVERDGNHQPALPTGPLSRATLIATWHMAIPIVVLTLNSLRVRQCEPMMGLLYMLLGPYLGTWLAAWLAALTSTLTPVVRWRVMLALAPPLIGLGCFAYNFYATPAIKAYGHFFGYFPGSFYDELIRFPPPLLWMRLGSVALLAAILSIFRFRSSPKQLRAARRMWMLGATCCVLCAAYIESRGPELGFRVSTTHIQATLGATVRSKRCIIHLPREYAQRRRFALDCDFRVQQMEHFFGLRQPQPVRVYLFRSAAEKRDLIGAADTNIAKPWRNEIYVQEDSFPHPLLAHEIAHVVVGNSGRDPFRVAASFFGLWPNPGIIEGMAMAADFRPQSDLTPNQWAKAAIDNHLAPSLSTLFGANFYNHPQGLSYTLAGSFLHFVYERHGRDALRRLYRENNLEAALGQSLSAAERDWHRYLATVTLPPSAAALAQQRFGHPGVLSAVCPHRMAAMQSALHGAMQAGDLVEALVQCDAALALDKDQANFAAAKAVALARSGNIRAARQSLSSLATIASAPLIASTRQAIADALAEHGDFSEADREYAQLEQAPQTQGSLRELQVKRLGLQGSARQRELLLTLLLDRPGEEHDPGLAVHIARELRSERSDGLPHYLEARQLYFHEHFIPAATLFTTALTVGLPSAELNAEARRLEALCLLASGKLDAARQRYQELSRQGTAASRWEARDFLARIAFLTQTRGK